MKMINFRKNANCPSSQDLLAFQSSQNSTETGNQIKEHLMMCEFCVAEIELYAYCPQDEEKIKSEEIPLPLYELAEALLKRKCRDFSFLDKIFNKNPELELKKA